jgi:hypothetical protein
MHLFSEVTMQSKELVIQRPLFGDWPPWRQLPTEVRQQVERLLGNMCLEVVNPNNDSNDQEQSNERSTDKKSAS